MSDFINMLDGMAAESLVGINTCLIGRIEKFDPITMTADVQPLAYTQFADNEPELMDLLINVPVSPQRAGGFFIRVPYVKGDLVVVVFAQRSLDEVVETGEAKAANSKRKHSLDDAIVIGGFVAVVNPLPSEHAQDLVFATEDMAAKFVITKEKKVIIEAAEGVEIKGKSSTGSW